MCWCAVKKLLTHSLLSLSLWLISFAADYLGTAALSMRLSYLTSKVTVRLYTFVGFPSYGFLPTTSSLTSTERLGTSFYPEYGSVSAANQMVATLMARQGDSQLAISTPALLTDQYLSQRGLHSLSTSAARSVLPLADHAQDFGICHIFLTATPFSVSLFGLLLFPARLWQTSSPFLIPSGSV